MSNTPESDSLPPLRTTRLPSDEDAPPFPNPDPELYPFTPRVAVRRAPPRAREENSSEQHRRVPAAAGQETPAIAVARPQHAVGRVDDYPTQRVLQVRGEVVRDA